MSKKIDNIFIKFLISLTFKIENSIKHFITYRKYIYNSIIITSCVLGCISN